MDRPTLVEVGNQDVVDIIQPSLRKLGVTFCKTFLSVCSVAGRVSAQSRSPAGAPISWHWRCRSKAERLVVGFLPSPLRSSLFGFGCRLSFLAGFVLLFIGWPLFAVFM